MMVWKTNKEIPFGDYTARFMTLYEDTRDTMCDSPRPEYAIASLEKNRRVEVVNRDRTTVWYQDVTREEGNAMYKEMLPLDHYGYGRNDCLAWLQAHGATITFTSGHYGTT